jgi:hypothetical protein
MGLDYNMNTRDDGETATFNSTLQELPVDTTRMLFHQYTASVGVEPITSDNKKTCYQFIPDVLEAAEKVAEVLEDQYDGPPLEDQEYCPPAAIIRSVEHEACASLQEDGGNRPTSPSPSTPLPPSRKS